MGWSAIIAALLQLFGPVLVEWLKKWLESLLNRSASRMTAATEYPSEQEAAEALLDQALDQLPRFAPARRTMLRWMRRTVTQRVNEFAWTPLTPVELVELSDAVQAAENE